MKNDNMWAMAHSINRQLFNGAIDFSYVSIEKQHKMIDGDNIAGITYGFITKHTKQIICNVYIFGKYCKGKKMIRRVLAHELVHVYQFQLGVKANHNGALMRHYCKKARSLGYEIDMKRF